jgi:hypothetical protein
MTGNGARMISWSIGLWILWTVSAWWFEGRIETLRRPDAVADRLIYTVVVNILIGVVVVAFVLRRLLAGDTLSTARIGFGPRRRTAICIAVGITLGLALFFGQGAPSTDPVVVLNAYAQVFVVSMAEVKVCWALVGGTVALGIEGPSWAAIPVAIVVASLLFGVYHFAYSAPFNTLGMVIFLSGGGPERARYSVSGSPVGGRRCPRQATKPLMPVLSHPPPGVIFTPLRDMSPRP